MRWKLPSKKRLGELVMESLAYVIAWVILTVSAFALIIVWVPPDPEFISIFGWRILAAYLLVSVVLGYRWIRRGPGLI